MQCCCTVFIRPHLVWRKYREELKSKELYLFYDSMPYTKLLDVLKLPTRSKDWQIWLKWSIVATEGKECIYHTHPSNGRHLIQADINNISSKSTDRDWTFGNTSSATVASLELTTVTYCRCWVLTFKKHLHVCNEWGIQIWWSFWVRLQQLTSIYVRVSRSARAQSTIWIEHLTSVTQLKSEAFH